MIIFKIFLCVLFAIVLVSFLVLCRLCDVYIYLRKKEENDEQSGKESK